VNMTVEPAHTGLAEAEIRTLTEAGVVTDIVIMLEVAGLPEVQDKEDVITQLTKSPLEGI